MMNSEIPGGIAGDHASVDVGHPDSSRLACLRRRDWSQEFKRARRRLSAVLESAEDMASSPDARRLTSVGLVEQHFEDPLAFCGDDEFPSPE
jgi:hypothetical protein